MAPARRERVVETAIAEATGWPGPHGVAAIVDAIIERHHQRRGLGRRRLAIALRDQVAADEIGILGEFQPAPILGIGGLDDEALALRRGHGLEARNLGGKAGRAGAESQQCRWWWAWEYVL